MEFTLYYRGELKANRGSKEKQILRRHFHEQLKLLWQQLPLNDMHKLLDKHQPEGDVTIIKSKGKFDFAPLITEKLNLVAELKITMLRPGAPGSIISQSGDIDNRLKTLLDALKVPSEPTAIPTDDLPQHGESPLFCLLEDDSLITKIKIETDRLLDVTANSSEVVLLIHVTTKATRATWANIALG